MNRRLTPEDHYYDNAPMGVNGYCPTSGFPEWGYDEPSPDPFEDPNETSAQLEARMIRMSADAKKRIAEMDEEKLAKAL